MLTEEKFSPGITNVPHALANALIVVDTQQDFCPGGSLPVAGGDKVARQINNYIRSVGDDYRIIVATKCWHPDTMNFEHFSLEPDYKDTWPRHCVQNTPGAMFHPDLKALPDAEMIPGVDPEMWIAFDAIFFKGQTSAAYSGFEGVTDPAIFTLDDYLKKHGVGHVDVVGLATDFCVKATAIDAVKAGYSTSVLLDKCAAVSPEGHLTATNEMLTAGVELGHAA